MVSNVFGFILFIYTLHYAVNHIQIYKGNINYISQKSQDCQVDALFLCHIRSSIFEKKSIEVLCSTTWIITFHDYTNLQAYDRQIKTKRKMVLLIDSKFYCYTTNSFPKPKDSLSALSFQLLAYHLACTKSYAIFIKNAFKGRNSVLLR